ncbi:MAG: hypothetical protein EU535_07330 [Promethearchaeota archaeon]|nr:MAG: hypothetical protein EU535_07330 [Candidatus Lokiarchaeota archaeon]
MVKLQFFFLLLLMLTLPFLLYTIINLKFCTLILSILILVIEILMIISLLVKIRKREIDNEPSMIHNDSINDNNKLENYLVNSIKKYQINKEISEYLNELKQPDNFENYNELIEYYQSIEIDKVNDKLTGFTFKQLLILVELIGIILGDGHITFNRKKSEYLCEIAFNSLEMDYVYYVNDLIKYVFDIKPKLEVRKKDNTTLLRIFKKEIIQFLLDLGLKAGNKVRNQVEIPFWIKKRPPIEKNKKKWELFYKYVKSACLRGLLDTDGSIYLSWHKKKNYLTIGMNFTNASQPLVEDFKVLCDSLGIGLSKISKYVSIKNNKRFIAYSVSTEAKRKIYNLIFEIIKPYKWVIKQPIIEEKLTEIGLSIRDILVYERPRRDYNRERALYLKLLFEKLGNYNSVREYLINKGEAPIKKETISKFIKEYLQQQGKDYETWIRLNSNIRLDEKVVGGLRMPLEVKLILSKHIFNVLLENCLEVDNDTIIEYTCFFIKNSDLDRLHYLLENNSTKDLILDFLKVTIYLLKYIIDNKFKRHSPTIVRKELEMEYNIKLPYHDSHIKKLVSKLFDKKKNFNTFSKEG